MEQQIGLSEIAKCPMIPATLSEYGKSFICSYLYKHFIQVQKILPPGRQEFDDVKKDVATAILQESAGEVVAHAF